MKLPGVSLPPTRAQPEFSWIKEDVLMLRRLVVLFVLFNLSWAFGAAAEGKSLKALVQRTDPSVVVIVSKETVYTKEKPREAEARLSLGSGFVVSSDGKIMTAAHVAEYADEVSVQFVNGKVYDAEVVSVYAKADVALLKLKEVPDDLCVAELGDSDLSQIGDEVYVIGSPLGMTHTLTVGHLSGKRETARESADLFPIQFLQTDAAVNSGNSGGPMFNMDGKVIGIVSHILTQTGGFMGLGFAASINTAKEALLLREPFWSGIEFRGIAGEFAKALNVPHGSGLLVQRVAEKSPGALMGLKPGSMLIQLGQEEILIGGDVVVEINDIRIVEDQAIMGKIKESISTLPKGGTIKIKVLRGGEVMALSTTK